MKSLNIYNKNLLKNKIPQILQKRDFATLFNPNTVLSLSLIFGEKKNIYLFYLEDNWLFTTFILKSSASYFSDSITGYKMKADSTTLKPKSGLKNIHK